MSDVLGEFNFAYFTLRNQTLQSSILSGKILLWQNNIYETKLKILACEIISLCSFTVAKNVNWKNLVLERRTELQRSEIYLKTRF